MDLSPRGHEQAAALAQYVRRRPVDAVYVSPMRRAQLTLAPLADHCPRPAITRPVSPSLGTQLVHDFVTIELHGDCQLSFPPTGVDHWIEFPS